MGNTWRIKRHVLIKRTFFNGVVNGMKVFLEKIYSPAQAGCGQCGEKLSRKL